MNLSMLLLTGWERHSTFIWFTLASCQRMKNWFIQRYSLLNSGTFKRLNMEDISSFSILVLLALSACCRITSISSTSIGWILVCECQWVFSMAFTAFALSTLYLEVSEVVLAAMKFLNELGIRESFLPR